ncbi:MAG: sensor histidine kinase N-terminal domain-containing protein [Zoogloeaceae bacterium]|nr:sensor histidine kinase N-terminal domain-containing protein [Rhodocyclaceae bacterium]MCP5235058.1 sensor histidine kinase N-terminal domain-containing protein [Zoogloeaceae bacterium]
MGGAKRYSLRGRLMLSLIGSMAVLWLGAAVAAFLHALEEADELFDAQMVQASEMLLGLVKGTDTEQAISRTAEQTHPYRMPVFYQVMDLVDGRWRMLAHTPDGADGLPPPERLADGFCRIDLSSVPWRIFVRSEQAGDGSLYRVVVGQRYAIRDDLGHEFAEHLLIPLAVGFPLMALSIWWFVGRAMRPVREAAGDVLRMPVDGLHPLDLSGPCPHEIMPLIEAIDGLTHRVTRAIENERRFTADAAHELRTPLAALRIHAQLAARIDDPVERRRAHDKLLVGVERMTHLVEQLLTLARLDPAAGGGIVDATADLSDVAATVCADLMPLAIGRGQEIQLEAPDPAPVQLDATWVELLVRNLVDNALRYGRIGGCVDLRVENLRDSVRLTVRDDGPGVAAAERGRLLERFYRAGDSEGEGCGLGLSIVARIVESTGAGIEFVDGLVTADGGTGLGVRIDLPSAPPQPRIGQAGLQSQPRSRSRSSPCA